ncbi:MAG: Mur ligase family protein [Methanosphaera sp.]|nr:Mur ligase family protein [Methanosphaera sp.]
MKNSIRATQLADIVEGKLYGEDRNLTGHFTFLNKAKANDVVIRHWINGKGIEIANDKNVSCVITQNPQDDAIKTAQKLNMALIVTGKIELATAYAIKTTVDNYAHDAFRMAITGTNGKSTTSHLLYTIFNDCGFKTYTNTDAESEGNTLIDPRVAVELVDYVESEGKMDAISLEVSEVQGWDDRIMKDHAYLMISALNTDVSIITNASADHMNLVESFDDLLNEIGGAARALLNNDKKSLLVLNYDDENIRRMGEIVQGHDNITLMYFGEYFDDNELSICYRENDAIYANGHVYIEYDDLPFTSKHFIQDIMAAIAVCVYKNLDRETVVESLRNYKALSRRFIKLRDNPVVIDDFAHNPSGIKLTIENGSKLGDRLFVVDAIRGCRGDDINRQIAEALVESLKNEEDYTLLLTCSRDVVNNLNTVLDSELDIFTRVLDDNSIEYVLFDNLEDSLLEAMKLADKKDVVLLLGAQGMDPASKLLEKNNII